MKKFREYLLICIALAAVTVVVTSALGVSGAKNRALLCSGVDIVVSDSLESRFVSREDVEKYLAEGYGECAGKEISRIDFTEIEKSVNSKSAVLKCEAYATDDGILHLEMTQRKPLIRFQSATGGFYADEGGYLFPLKDNYTSYVVIVDGHLPLSVSSGYKGRCSDDAEAAWLDDMISMVKYMKKSTVWADNIVQIHVEGNGDLVLIPREGKEKFIFGKPGGYEDKFGLMSYYYKSIVPAKGENHYSSVNVKFGRQIICKK